jgi:hypothetical protein
MDGWLAKAASESGRGCGSPELNTFVQHTCVCESPELNTFVQHTCVTISLLHWIGDTTLSRMADTEILRYNAALEHHEHAVCTHAKWIQEVRNDVAFNGVKGDVETVDRYERNKLDIILTNIQIEHCKAMIRIRDNSACA